MLAKQNKPEEHKPWPIITTTAPFKPHQPNTTRPDKTRPI